MFDATADTPRPPSRGFKPAVVTAVVAALTDYQCLLFDRHGRDGDLMDAIQQEIDQRGLTRWER